MGSDSHLESAVLLVLLECFDRFDGAGDLGKIDERAALIWQSIDLFDLAIFRQIALDLVQSEGLEIVNLTITSAAGTNTRPCRLRLTLPMYTFLEPPAATMAAIPGGQAPVALPHPTLSRLFLIVMPDADAN